MKKHSKIWMLGLVLLCLWCTSCSSSIQLGRILGTDVATVYSEDDENSPIIGYVQGGEVVEIQSESFSGWVKIKAQYVEGYVNSDVQWIKENGDLDYMPLNWGLVNWGILKGAGGMIVIILAILLALAIIGLIMWGIMFILGWLWSIMGWVICFGALAGILGFFVTHDADGGFTWMGYGAGLGVVIGLIRAIMNPLKAASEGIKDMGKTMKPKYTIELESGLKAKRDPVDSQKLIDEQGREWRDNGDGTSSPLF